MEILKPCPFCNNEPMHYKSFSKVTIGCRNVDCHVKPMLSVGKRENPEAKWNERVCDINYKRLVEENAELREALSNAILDCEKVITNLTNTGCDEAWSIIKLNNMIADCKLPLSPTCQGCDGNGEVTDTFDVVWPCPECHGSGKLLAKHK